MPSKTHLDKLSFSPVCEDDFEDLLALRIEAMRESLSRIGRFDPSRARERFRSGFSPEHTRHLVVSGERVGFVTVKPRDFGLLLDHLYVHPKFQGRGLGALALGTVFREADSLGLALRVGALKESDSNRFYERHGFQKVEEGEWDNYYVRPCQTIV
jgi:GNAT superfamily N-acetyltransferase